MSTKMKVNTKEISQVVHHPVTNEVLGNIVSRVYEGENVQRHSFLSSEGKEFSLGPTTEAFNFVDWPDVFKPVLDEGYQIEKLSVSRGGLRMHAVLSNPTGPTYKDPIHWDQATWGKSKGLKDSVVIHGGLRPGSGFHFQRGLFRLICTNGLTIETLGLGKGDFNHINYEPDAAASALFGQSVVIGSDIIGQQIGTVKALTRTKTILEKAISNPETYEDLPHFARELVSPLTDFPKRFANEALQQFDALIQNAGRKEVYEMDIANVLTGAANRLPEPPARLAFKILPAQRSISKLVSLYSL